jgi:hypothetical protein
MKLLCINTNQHKLNIYTVLNRYIHCLLHLYVQSQHAKSIASKSPLKSGQSRSELSHKIYSVPSSTFIMQHFLNSDNSVFSSDNDTHPNSCAQVLTVTKIVRYNNEHRHNNKCLPISLHCRILITINPLRMKCSLFYLKSQFVPHSKHIPSRL